MTDLFESPDQGDNIDPNKDYFSELVGDGKKFKDPKDLAKAKIEADAFIERLKRENAQMREEITKRTNIEEFMTQLNDSRNDTNTGTPNNQQGESGGSQNPQLSQTDIEKLLEQKINERESARNQQQNLAFVKQQLTQSIGPDYVNHLDAITSELGMTREQAQAMAANQPKVFLKLVGASEAKSQVTQQNDLFAAPRGQSPGFKPSNTERNQAYYDNLKNQDPKLYWSPKIQNQMHSDALKLGERFFTSQE